MSARENALRRLALGGMYVENTADWDGVQIAPDQAQIEQQLSARDLLASTRYARELHCLLTERAVVGAGDAAAADPMAAVFELLGDRDQPCPAFAQHRAALLETSSENTAEALRGDSPHVLALLAHMGPTDVDRAICLLHALGHIAAVLLDMVHSADGLYDVTLLPRTTFLVYLVVTALAGDECMENKSAAEAADLLALITCAAAEFVTCAANEPYARALCAALETLYIVEERARVERAMLTLQQLTDESPTCTVLYTTMATAHVLRISELAPAPRGAPAPPHVCMATCRWSNRAELVQLDAYEPSADGAPALMQRIVMARVYAHLLVRMNLVHRLPALVYASNPAPGRTFTEWLSGTVALYVAAAADL